MNRLATFMTIAMAIVIPTQNAFASQSIALTNVNILDVKSLTVLAKHTVIIKDEHIIQVGKSAKIETPKDSIVIDLSGKYIAPGLIDAHVHHATEPNGFDNREDTLKRLRNLLRGGVTSVRDMGGDTRVLAGLARDAMLDQIQSPDIYYSVIIGGPTFFADPRTVASAQGHKSGDVPWMASIDENTNLDHVMLKALGTGATGIKIYADLPARLIKPLADTAKKYGLKVWSHVYIGPVKPSEAINAGIETLSHAPDLSAEIIENYKSWRRKNIKPNNEQIRRSFDPESYQTLLAQFKRSGAILDATMTVFNNYKDKNENTAKRYRHASLLAKLANEYNIPIGAGTDAFSDDEVQLYNELELLVNDAQLTPFEALQSATLTNAKIIGQSDVLGFVAKGMLANLVIFNKNPTEDINHINTIAHVIKNGRFVYRGADDRLPFIPAKKVGDTLWMSGQIGNFPGTMTLASSTAEGQMKQTMDNIGSVLKEYGLNFNHLTKCTLMLADINDWATVSEVYKSYFPRSLPTRSAFATNGLALGAKLEVECLATY